MVCRIDCCTPMTSANMAELALFFSYEFTLLALAAGLLASVLGGVLGTFVVVKRLVFIAGGISHAAFAGLGFFYWLGFDPLIGAVLVAVAAALFLGLFSEGQARSQDAMIGVLWAGGMAVGVLFIHLTPGYAPNLMTYLFGDILTVAPRDVVLLAVLAVVTLALLAVLHRGLIAVAFDETFARVQGVPVRALTLLLLVLVALAVILLIQVVGIVLLLALFTLPPMIALMLINRSFALVLLVAVLVGMLMTTGGIAASWTLDLPTGPAIVLTGIVFGSLIWAGKAVSRGKNS